MTAIGAFIGLVAMASISCVNAVPYHSATQLWNDTLAKTDDDCWLAHEGLAVEILRQTNPSQEAARRELELSLRIHPHQVEAHILIGQLLVSRNNFTGAIAEFGAAHAVADQPNDIRPGVQIADALLRQGLKAQAAAALDNLLAMDADDIDLHLQYAVLLDNDGQASQAVDQCRAAVALDNGNDRAWADLADCLWHLGNFPDAADAMLHAINLGPPDAQRLDTYGMILLADENIDPAIAQFNAALKLDPGLVMAHRNLAAAYMKQGRVADAQKELRRAQNSTGG
jgi:tetratricopeptide (TPR) repeat protein